VAENASTATAAYLRTVSPRSSNRAYLPGTQSGQPATWISPDIQNFILLIW
jgi:hypothetical protein